MLAYLQGTIKDRQNGEMILLVGDEARGWVGYQVKTPDHYRYESLLPGEKAEMYIYSHVREDAFDLFGFQNSSEKNLFTTLLSVSGVGPKLALSLLSHTDESNLIEMILSEDKAGLTGISGVGKKTAERIVLELKDVIEKKIMAGFLKRPESTSKPRIGSSRVASGSSATADRASKLFMEAYLALQGLGFKELQAKQMVDAAFQKQESLSRVEDVVKLALQGGA